MRHFISLLLITAGLSTTAAESVQGWIGARYIADCPPNPTIRHVLPGAPMPVIVESISLDSPAAAAGLQVGDCITAVGDFEAKSVRSLAAHIRRSKPGQPQVFHIDRDGTLHRINVVVGERRVKRKGSVGLGFVSPSLKISASLSSLELNLFNLIRLEGRPDAQWSPPKCQRRYRQGSSECAHDRRRLFSFSALLFLDLEQESTHTTSSEGAPEPSAQPER